MKEAKTLGEIKIKMLFFEAAWINGTVRNVEVYRDDNAPAK